VRPKTNNASTSVPANDRRAEERFSADGEVKLAFSDPVRMEINGNLLDYSKSGFRAVHSCRALHTGQVVEFRHFIAQGQARVMWNRILEESVETGFLVLHPAPAAHS
jgi:hypothetical protein